VPFKAYAKSIVYSYMMCLAILAAVLLAALVIYFPAKPPRPPCTAGEVKTVKSLKSWKVMMRNKQLWLVCLSFAIPGGIQLAWQVSLTRK